MVAKLFLCKLQKKKKHKAAASGSYFRKATWGTGGKRAAVVSSDGVIQLFDIRGTLLATGKHRAWRGQNVLAVALWDAAVAAER